MKIKEILELTKTKPIADIAKELPVSEKPLRTILKGLKAEKPAVGAKGWSYENVDAADLEKDISEFVKRKAKAKKVASNGDILAEIKEDGQNDIKYDKIENDNIIVTNENKEADKMNDKIAIMMQGLEIARPKKQFRGFYLDADITEIIDRIKVGNKSEFVSEIIRRYLKENNYI
jgi:predicted transcriptional regulator